MGELQSAERPESTERHDESQTLASAIEAVFRADVPDQWQTIRSAVEIGTRGDWELARGDKTCRDEHHQDEDHGRSGQANNASLSAAGLFL